MDDGDTDKSQKKKEKESKNIPDTFNGFLTSLSMWIVDGERDDSYFIDEIKKRYVEEDISPEQRFINWWFWDMQQEDIDIGMPFVLKKAYDGQASPDELIALMQKVHAMKEHYISLSCEVDYKKIELMDNQLYAWNNRRLFIAYLNGEKRELYLTLDGFYFYDQNYSTKYDVEVTVQNLKSE